MTRLRAISISSSVVRVSEAGFVGHVHSVFRRVVNVLDEDRLVTIADEGIGDLPNGIKVAMDSRFQFSDTEVRPGMIVRGTNRELVVAEADLRVNLEHAQIASAKKRILPPSLLSSRECLANLKLAQRLAIESGRGEGLATFWGILDRIIDGDPGATLSQPVSLLSAAAAGPVRRMTAALQANDASAAGAAAGELAGLGVGLTPSGDDVLTGIVGAVALLGDATAAGERYEALLATIANAARNRTNIIARTYLDHALLGETTSVLFDFICSLTTGSVGSVTQSATALFRMGSTSGVELALGAAIGVWSLLDQHTSSIGIAI